MAEGIVVSVLSVPQAGRGAAGTRALVVPRDEEEAVVVGVFEGDEATAPALVGGRGYPDAARADEVVELVHVLDREEEVYAAPAPRHREGDLREHQSQAARAQRRHRRLGLGRVRLKL